MSQTNEIGIFDEIIKIGKLAHSHGLLSGTSGNISVRTGKTTLLITASGTHKGMLEYDDLIACDLSGQPINESPERQLSSEIKLHTFIYRNRPEIRAVIHAHPAYAIIASLIDLDFSKQVLPETILSLGTIKIAAYGTPTTEALVTSIESYIENGYRNIILKRHGTLNIASSLKTAYANLETLEHVAKISITAKLLGCSDRLPQSEIEKLNTIKQKLFC